MRYSKPNNMTTKEWLEWVERQEANRRIESYSSLKSKDPTVNEAIARMIGAGILVILGAMVLAGLVAFFGL